MTCRRLGTNAALAVGLAAIVSCSATAGEIALSFDDAPTGDGAFLTGMERTELLIDRLDSLGIDEVVFFCTSERLHGPVRKKRLRMYGEAGHKIANHSYSHPHPHQTGAKYYLADVDRGHRDLSEFPGFVKWFRYPFLDEGRTRPLRDSIRTALAERSYLNGYVTVDNYDWYMDRLTRNAADEGAVSDTALLREFFVESLWNGILFYDQIARDVLGRSPKHVLLLHEYDVTALFIDALVHRIRGEGWTIISPTEAYSDPIADSLPDVLLNNQGRVAAIANAHGMPARDLAHPTESMRYLDSVFSARGIIRKSGSD